MRTVVYEALSAIEGIERMGRMFATFGNTHLLEGGADLRTVQEILYMHHWQQLRFIPTYQRNVCKSLQAGTPARMMTSLVVIPTYNEVESIALLEELKTPYRYFGNRRWFT